MCGNLNAGLVVASLGTLIASAVVLFVVTHIDNLVILALFFGRGAYERGSTAKISAGQYLGFVGVLAASIAIAHGARFLA